MKNFLIGIMATLLFTTAFAQLDPMVDYRFTGVVIRDQKGVTARDPRVVAAFRKMWECPSTGAHIGACPGWAVDHVVPLACGGIDATWNMQWLPTQIKSAPGPYSKDHFERRVYGGRGMSVGCQ